MSNQDQAWSQAAEVYEQHFINPYQDDIHNPLLDRLPQFANKSAAVADCGCGTGPLLPSLSEQFGEVYAIDFAEGMLKHAREQNEGRNNIQFYHQSLTTSLDLPRKVDLALAVNSLVMAHPTDLQRSIENIVEVIKPGGHFMGIVPAIDAVHYHTMLLLDRALATGMPLSKAQQNAAEHSEHALYNFSFGEFRYRGLVQHFWQPFEIHLRLRKAGLQNIHVEKVELPWNQFPLGWELKDHPLPWDWFFVAEKP